MKNTLALGIALIGAFALGTIVVSYGNARSGETSIQTPNQIQELDTNPGRVQPPAEPAPRPDAAPRASKPVTNFSAAQADDIRTIMYDFLLDNPEMLVEAFTVLEERRELAKFDNARKNLAVLLGDEGGFVTGADRNKAKVAVIELFDYHCGYCKQASGLMRDLARDDEDVIVAFREFPILRKESEFAAQAALASRSQGKYLELHFAMMNSSGTLTKDRILEIAKKENIDVKRLLEDAARPEVVQALTETYAVMDELGLSATPAFIIATLDGKFLDIVNGFKPDAVMAAVNEAKSVAARN